jgi:hypothetical protein
MIPNLTQLDKRPAGENGWGNFITSGGQTGSKMGKAGRFTPKEISQQLFDK